MALFSRAQRGGLMSWMQTKGHTPPDDEISLDENGHLTFGPNDPTNPKNWPLRRRYWITAIVIIIVLNATFASSAPSGAIDGLSKDLHVSVEAAGLVTTLFLLGYTAGPLLWGPLSEFYGRQMIFFVTFTLYLIFNFLCAFSPNFAGVLVGRFLSGAFASSALSNVPGTLSDIWGPVARGHSINLFLVVTFVGPALGPVISGFLQLTKTWRWTFYVLLWMAGITEPFMFILLPETLPSMILLRRARRLREAKVPGYENVMAPVETTDRRLSSIFYATLTRPWKLLIDPICFLVCIYFAVTYALLYMLFSIYPIVFQQKRGWNAGVGELPLLGVAIGAALGGAIIFVLGEREKNNKNTTPEDRLPGAMIGAVLFAVAMFWFAWTGEYNSVPWIVPTLAGTFLSTSLLLIFVGFMNYLVDSYLAYAASTLAACTVVRAAAAAASPLFTQYMFDALGVGGGGSLIGGIAVLLLPIPFAFYKYGAPLRRRSKYAPTANVAGRKQDEENQEEEKGSQGDSPGNSQVDR